MPKALFTLGIFYLWLNMRFLQI